MNSGISTGATCGTMPVCRRQTVSRPRFTPLRRATSEMLAPGAALSATMRAFSSTVYERRCRRPVITSIRRYGLPSSMASSLG